MKKNFKLGVIGAGFMANAIINGVLTSGAITPQEIFVSDINANSLEKLKNIGVNVTLNNSEVFENAEYILLAVKPQTFISMESDNTDKVEKVISIMAGVNKAKIKQTFINAKIVRCMPNTPVSVGFGAVAVDCSDLSNEKDVDFVKNIFSAVAKVVLVNEEDLSAVTGISGSSPAYFYLFAKSLIDAGVTNGLAKADAENLVLSTMKGAVVMMENRQDKTIDDLINAVCSKGGTTIEAMKVFYDEKLQDITLKAVNSCINRANELEKL